MKSCLVLWEAPNWSKMDWFEFQLLYVSPAYLLVLPLMSSKMAKRLEEEDSSSETADGLLEPGGLTSAFVPLSTPPGPGFQWACWRSGPGGLV